MLSTVAAALVTLPLADQSDQGNQSPWADMFSFQITPVEKIARTVLVYLGIAIVIRICGKRLMAQMNSLDLVVVLLLSNVVQNAIIGNDNSLIGGLLGALVLVLVNAGLERLAHRVPAVRYALEGRDTEVIRDGSVDRSALSRLGMTEGELSNALRHQGADSPSEVALASLEPGGSVTVNLKRDDQAASYGDLRRAVEELRAHLDARLAGPR